MFLSGDSAGKFRAVCRGAQVDVLRSQRQDSPHRREHKANPSRVRPLRGAADSRRLRIALGAAGYRWTLATRRIPGRRRRPRSASQHRIAGRNPRPRARRHRGDLRHARRPHADRTQQQGLSLLAAIRGRAQGDERVAELAERSARRRRKAATSQRALRRSPGDHGRAAGAARRRNRHEATEHRARAGSRVAIHQPAAGGGHRRRIRDV